MGGRFYKEKIMNCPVCRNGILEKGHTTVVLELSGSTIIIKNVPAKVCDNCSEAFVAEDVSKKLLDTVHNEAKKGVEIEILTFAA